MLTLLSTIIDRWNETCLNQVSNGQVRFKKNLVLFFCKILLKIFLIRIIYRSAMATTSVKGFSERKRHVFILNFFHNLFTESIVLI